MTPWQHPLGPGQIFSSEGFFNSHAPTTVNWCYGDISTTMACQRPQFLHLRRQLITIRTSKNQQQSEAEETIWRG